MINENLARRAKENMSFTGYTPGSATKDFNETIQNVKDQIDKAKLIVSDEAKERLDRLYNSYVVSYASWTNRRNASGAGHVSVMISGPSNYNMRAHEKFLKRESKLWEEYEKFKDINYKIQSIVSGDKIIKSNDIDAIEKLNDKLTKALATHQSYKDHNIKARKEGTPVIPSFTLTNSNARIKSIKDRIATLEKIAKQAAETPKEITEINGIEIIDNLELQRLQIIFPGKPDAATRTALKKNGFRWAPSNGAWQSYRSSYALNKAKSIVESLT